MQLLARRRLPGMGVATIIIVAAAAVSLAAGSAGASGTSGASSAGATVSREAIHYVGTVNLRAAAQALARSSQRTYPQGSRLGAKQSGESYRIVAARNPFRKHTGAVDVGSNFPVTPGQVPGEAGFIGLGGHDQAVVNHNLDLEPPDQGLCAGNGNIGEFINNAFAVYDSNGIQLKNTLPSYAIFKQPSTAFLSDPRCHYDAPTQRWFLAEFVVGNASGTIPSVQYLAVSNTSDVLGSYTIWSINTSDKGTPHCPCLGDFDQTGFDQNGVYIATNEFGIAGGYNGAVIYAISKQTLENFATTGIPAKVFVYRLTNDPFGVSYHVSPASTPPGASFAPNTEYFVESNAGAFSDNHLVVYAMKDTSRLASPQPAPAPTLVRTMITSEPYALGPSANQKKGPIPLGNANQDPEGRLQSDFDAVQEVTYTGGQLYAELDTGVSGSRNGTAWFVITPHLVGSGVTAKIVHQGYVTVTGQHLLYPVIAVNAAGRGYLAFTLTGSSYYPSAAYIPFTPTGPTGAVHIAAPGAKPEDSFTCYAAFVGPTYGGCRWGDYSMGVAMGSQIWLSTEYVPPTSRDYLTNWGTFVWHAPPTTP